MPILKGTWKFNDVLTLPAAGVFLEGFASFTASFLYFGDSYEIGGIKLYADEDGLKYHFNSTKPDIGLPPDDPMSVWVFTKSDMWNIAEYGDDLQTIDFGTEPQSVSAEFYNWFTENATEQTTIIYNGEVIASLSVGQTATMACASKKAKSGIVVNFASAGTITYNGTKTAVEAGKTATLSCAGKKMLTDVVIIFN